VEAKYCLQTIVGHRSEIWTLSVYSHPTTGDLRILTGSSDDQIRVYSTHQKATNTDDISAKDDDIILDYLGCFARTSYQQPPISLHHPRITSIATNYTASLIAVISNAKTIDFYRIRSADEIKQKRKKRMKKLQQQQQQLSAESTVAANTQQDAFQVTDEYDWISSIKHGSRVTSFNFTPHLSSNSTVSMVSTATEEIALIALNNNTLEAFKIPFSIHQETDNKPAKVSVIDLCGHRSDIRSLSISSDGNLIATASAEVIKLWHGRSYQPVGTCMIATPPTSSSSASALVCLNIAFVPGGRFIVATMKDGTVQVIRYSQCNLFYSTLFDYIMSFYSIVSY
jgi:U3 small nucleolar RNA-associated protein 12